MAEESWQSEGRPAHIGADGKLVAVTGMEVRLKVAPKSFECPGREMVGEKVKVGSVMKPVETHQTVYLTFHDGKGKTFPWGVTMNRETGDMMSWDVSPQVAIGTLITDAD